MHKLLLTLNIGTRIAIDHLVRRTYRGKYPCSNDINRIKNKEMREYVEQLIVYHQNGTLKTRNLPIHPKCRDTFCLRNDYSEGKCNLCRSLILAHMTAIARTVPLVPIVETKYSSPPVYNDNQFVVITPSPALEPYDTKNTSNNVLPGPASAAPRMQEPALLNPEPPLTYTHPESMPISSVPSPPAVPALYPISEQYIPPIEDSIFGPKASNSNESTTYVYHNNVSIGVASTPIANHQAVHLT